MRLLWRLTVALALVFLSFPVGGADLAAAADDYDVAGGHFFTQTGGGGGKGFTVRDEGGIRMWSEFRRLGGVQAVGYPISQRFQLDGFTVQAMQRVIFQWRPEANQVFFVNTFDVLTQAGKDDWLLENRQTPLPLPGDFDAGKDWPAVLRTRLALLDTHPAIRAKFNSVVGDPVQMNGLPTSRVTDMGNHFALRAQRAVYQQWKETVPWAKAGEVTVALGGSIMGEAGLLPQEALAAETGPSAVAAPASAAQAAPAAPAPSAPPPPSTAGAGGFGYGMQVDQNNDYGRALALTKQAGFGWVKVQVRWEDLEPEKGNINWGFFDNAIGGAQGAGARVLLSVVTAPMWSRPPGSDAGIPGPPSDPQNFANFVGAIAGRYAGKVGGYEIWNEQNLAREWGGNGKMNAGQYVDLLKASYRAIKAADPAAAVVVGALTPADNVNLGQGLLAVDDVQFFNQMYDAGMKGFFDAVGAHPSGFNNAPDLNPLDGAVLGRAGSFRAHRSFYFRNFERYRDVMVARGDSAKRIWVTEFGWATGG
ncbi:MAG: cellulase family glycosylhydrolase, partial [Chloroflexi bacterium]|nr:cellulase family glycosylhydrolase [Chloroflexota bacterium]